MSWSGNTSRPTLLAAWRSPTRSISRPRSAHPCANCRTTRKKSDLSTKNHRSNMPRESEFTYGSINMFNVAQPNTTDESSPSVSLSYSRRRAGMRGCWILRIGWLRAWHAMGSQNPSISKKPMSPSRSIGKGTTASRVPHSSSSIAIPAKPEPSWDTRRINSNTSGKAEISNIFG